MILTPIAAEALPGLFTAFHAGLPPRPARLFARIVAAPGPARRDDAVALARRLGIAVSFESPTEAFSWDGRVIRVGGSEPSVIIHEVAHYQLSAPARRWLADFGLGAGPESGRRTEADEAQTLFGDARELEEQLTSLLGIAWEAALGHRARDALLEQNWLEGGAADRNLRHFARIADRLHADGFLNGDGVPALCVRWWPD